MPGAGNTREMNSTPTYPPLVYPANAARDVFYANSAVLVENAGNIRLEDLALA